MLVFLNVRTLQQATFLIVHWKPKLFLQKTLLQIQGQLDAKPKTNCNKEIDEVLFLLLKIWGEKVVVIDHGDEKPQKIHQEVVHWFFEALSWTPHPICQ